MGEKKCYNNRNRKAPKSEKGFLEIDTDICGWLGKGAPKVTRDSRKSLQIFYTIISNMMEQ
jgi:hypothetical protein